MWFSPWSGLHYKYIEAAWKVPAFIITHLAGWLNQPKQDIIAGMTECPPLPACQPVKIPLVGLIKLDLIWNEWCGLSCLSGPCVVIFISLSLRRFIFSYIPLRVITLLPSALMRDLWGSVQLKTVLFYLDALKKIVIFSYSDVWKIKTSLYFLCMTSNKHFCTTLVENRSCTLI